jgi:hypothetical protein
MSKTFLIKNGQEIPVASDKGIYVERSSPSAILTAPTTAYTAPPWLTIPWNTKTGDLNVTLSGGSITLPVAGKYLVTWNGPSGSVNSLKNLRAQAISGCNVYGYYSNYGANRAPADLYSNGLTFVVEAFQDNAVFELQYYSPTSNNLSGLRACIVQLNILVPHLVADGNGVVSSNQQRFVKINEDMTMEVNSQWRTITDWQTKLGYVEANSNFKPGSASDLVCTVRVNDVAQKIRFNIYNATTPVSSNAGFADGKMFLFLSNLATYIAPTDYYVRHLTVGSPVTELLTFSLSAWYPEEAGIRNATALTSKTYIYLTIELPLKPGAPLL